MEHPIKAVIFDMDGVLVDSEPLQFAASQQLFRHYSKRFTHNHLQEFFGKRLIDELAILKKRWALTTSTKDLLEERKAIYQELVRKKMMLSRGALTLLRFLKKNGTRIGLGTSAQSWYVSQVLAKFSLERFFDAIVTGDDVMHGKPHPEVYRKVASQLKISPEHCLVLEDAPSGIASAKAAYMRCFALLSKYETANKLKAADRVVHSFSEVMSHLSGVL